MKPEQKMWQALKKSVGNLWDAARHEDTLRKGVPDVSFGAKGVQGWIELKCLRSWPVREDTTVKIKHFTETQRVWLWKRGTWGGHTWLLLKVDRYWLLFDHLKAQRVGKELTHLGLIGTANKVWLNVPSGQEFIQEISR